MPADRGRSEWERPHVSWPLGVLLRTALGLLVLPAALILDSLAILLHVTLRGGSARELHRYYLWFARLCMRFGGTRLEVHGTENIEPGACYVIVVNHESTWDPPAVVAALPQLMIRFVAKRQLMRVPVLGHALRRTGNVAVVRTETLGDIRRIREAMDRRDPDVSILFFAEGTRSADGALRPFKKGAFTTALAYGLPILPVALAGTYAIMPKGTLRLEPRTVVVEVGEAIATDTLKLEDRFSLRDQTHAALVQLRTRGRRHLRDLGEDPMSRD